MVDYNARTLYTILVCMLRRGTGLTHVAFTLESLHLCFSVLLLNVS